MTGKQGPFLWGVVKSGLKFSIEIENFRPGLKISSVWIETLAWSIGIVFFESQGPLGKLQSLLSLVFGFVKEEPPIYQGSSAPAEPTKCLENTEQGNPLLKFTQGNPNNQGEEGQGKNLLRRFIRNNLARLLHACFKGYFWRVSLKLTSENQIILEEFPEFCATLGEFCEDKLGEFALAHKF